MNSRFKIDKGGFRKELRFTTIVLIIFILLLMSFSMLFINGSKADEDTLWEATILFTAAEYGSDNVIFGEDATAHDGPPTDLGLDALNPPPSTPPIIDAWFDAGLDTPYNKLREDIKYGPDSYKVWNLYVKTDPSAGYTVDMTWSYDTTSEYATIGLYDDTGTTLLVNMLATDTYSFVSTGTDHFQIICEGDSNGPPDIPTIPSGETEGYHGTSYTFHTSALDPEDDDIKYGWDWNGDGTVDKWTDFYFSGVTVYAANTWVAPGNYNIKVKAKDEHGAESGWSTPLTVNMLNRAPNKPSNPTPGNKSSDVDTNVILTWAGGDLDEGDLLNYDVYFGVSVSPPKVVSRQSGTSFNPALAGITTYYWKVVSFDDYGASTVGPIWSFTTSPGSDTSGDGDGENPNQLPVADASNSDISGLPGVSLTFDGSLSRDLDTDGYIKNWSWDFGDGTVRYGEIIKHAYANSGNYNVILTVTDNLDDTDTDSLSVVIGTENNPPSTPEITGNRKGKRNNVYSYTVMSVDMDNDDVRYSLDWGDGSTEESDFLPNGTLYRATHSWASAGVFTIVVTATDGLTVTDSTRLVVLIDAQYVDDLGYLIDKDGDGIYDSFYSNATRGETNVLGEGNEKYLIDSNDDGECDYSYDQILGTLSTYGEKEPLNSTSPNQIPVIFVLVAIVLIIIGIVATFIIIKI